MDIENQEIKIRVNNFNQKHLKELGYTFNLNDYIIIPVKHLPNGSGTKIKVACSYCGKTFDKAYRRYLETKDKLCCKKCSKKKMMESSLERYGNVCSLRNEKIGNKARNKNRENLGVDYPFQNKEILEKCHNSSVRKHGKGYRSITISKQQRKIHEFYGGKLNHHIFPYCLDIFFEKEKIYFEYDGSGHKLNVLKGRLTEEEFKNKEDKRRDFLKNKGLKEFRIISNTDKLPYKKELIRIKNKAFKMLENYQFYMYNLDTKTESFTD